MEGGGGGGGSSSEVLTVQFSPWLSLPEALLDPGATAWHAGGITSAGRGDGGCGGKRRCSAAPGSGTCLRAKGGGSERILGGSGGGGGSGSGSGECFVGGVRVPSQQTSTPHLQPAGCSPGSSPASTYRPITGSARSSTSTSTRQLSFCSPPTIPRIERWGLRGGRRGGRKAASGGAAVSPSQQQPPTAVTAAGGDGADARGRGGRGEERAHSDGAGGRGGEGAAPGGRLGGRRPQGPVRRKGGCRQGRGAKRQAEQSPSPLLRLPEHRRRPRSVSRRPTHVRRRR